MIQDDASKACQHHESKNVELTHFTLGITFSFTALFCLTFIILSLVNYIKLRSNNRKKYNRQLNLWQYERINLIANDNDDNDDDDDEKNCENNIQIWYMDIASN